MTILSTLDVINDMLGSMGEAPVSGLDVGHPLISAGLSAFRIANAREQGKGWWFNTELVTLSPDDSGNIFLPADTLKVDPTKTTLHYAQRGRRLYRLDSGSVDPYRHTAPVQVQLVRLIPFEELPVLAQLYVSYSAQLDFQRNMDGDTTKIQLLTLALRDAKIELSSEHIRARDVNLLRNGSAAASMAAIQYGINPGLPTR